MKTSKCTGNDRISALFIKETATASSLYTTHLYNSMIRTGTFPKSLKISKLTPIHKQRKPVRLRSSYRPIANLNAIEKVCEELMQAELSEYMESNNLLLDGHHGGRKGYSTLTAKSSIQYNMDMMNERKKVALLLTTYLSKAYDTVDHQFLLRKMRNYGVEDLSIKLMSSYFSDRYQYVESQTFWSSLVLSPPISVVQGSKMSTLLYNIYTNEVPIMHKLMDDPIMYRELTGNSSKDNTSVLHHTENYVDDSTSNIGADSIPELQLYVDCYIKLLYAVYDANFLQLNGDKTGMLLTRAERNNRISFTDRSLQVVTSKEQIKILGWLTNRRNSMDSHLNSII